MDVDYFYCPECGFEGFDLFVAYVRSTADQLFCECPACNKESSHFTVDE